jgi:hypothetical protein
MERYIRKKKWGKRSNPELYHGILKSSEKIKENLSFKYKKGYKYISQ